MLISTPSEVGAAIRDGRRRLGLDQRTLAEKVGVSRQWLIEVEKGKAGAEIGLVLRTFNALGISLNTAEQPRRRAATRSDAHVDIDAVVVAARKPRS
jgi:HTH-type transcriptional regulator / antitoxin HipB